MRCQAWIHNPQTAHTKRFHRDEKSIPQDPHIFVDSGRPFPGQPPLLTTRLHLKAHAAELRWQSLLQGGWRPCDPQWDAEADIYSLWVWPQHKDVILG